MTAPETFHVACSSTAVYAPHAATMLHSVLSNAGGHPVRITYLHGPTYPASTREKITGMVTGMGGAIDFLEIPDQRVEGLHTTTQFPRPMWYRIFLPELLPDVDKILYLDVDTIVVDSLEPLFELDLGDNYVAAVTNVFEPHFAHRPAALGVAQDAYFNSGVVVMNLALMRRDGISEKLRSYSLKKGSELFWVDQDALNVVLGARRLALHPRWNCMNSVLNFPWSPEVFGEAAVEEARRHPGIRHFEGPSANKPWHYMCDHGMRDLYFEHRRHTPWPRYRLDGRTPQNVVRRWLGLAAAHAA